MKLTETELDGMLYVYYINKLTEFKLIEGKIPKLTVKGFELAHDLYESGRKISMEMISQYTDVCFKDADDEFQEAIILFVKHLQDVGFEEMKSEIKKVESRHRN